MYSQSVLWDITNVYIDHISTYSVSLLYSTCKSLSLLSHLQNWWIMSSVVNRVLQSARVRCRLTELESLGDTYNTRVTAAQGYQQNSE